METHNVCVCVLVDEAAHDWRKISRCLSLCGRYFLRHCTTFAF